MHKYEPHSPYGFGVWVFFAPSSAANLTAETTRINAGLSKDYTRGLSLRYQWNDLEPTTPGVYDFSMLDQGLAMARVYNKDFSVRWTAGKQTPAHVFDVSGARNYTEAGSRIPHTCDTDGTVNQVFLDRVSALVTALIEWCRNNNVHLIHQSWFGNLYSEIWGNAPELLFPSTGYDAAGLNWLQAHYDLYDLYWNLLPADMAQENATSGLADQQPNGSGAIGTHIHTVVGDYNSRQFINANGLPHYVGHGGGNLTRGAQPLRPGDGTSEYWKAFFGGGVDLNNVEHSLRIYWCDYAEIFSNVFTLVNEANNPYDPLTWIGDPSTTSYLGSHEPYLARQARAFLLRGGRRPPFFSSSL